MVKELKPQTQCRQNVVPNTKQPQKSYLNMIAYTYSIHTRVLSTRLKPPSAYIAWEVFLINTQTDKRYFTCIHRFSSLYEESKTPIQQRISGTSNCYVLFALKNCLHDFVCVYLYMCVCTTVLM
jgi:hypothetical protein